MAEFSFENIVKEIREVTINELTGLFEQLTARIQQKIREKKLISSGMLVGSFQPTVYETDRGVRASTGSPLEHAEYMEFGTRAHWAPVDAIRKWVEQKIQPHVLAVGISVEGGRTRPTGRATRQLRGDQRQRVINQIAYLVNRKIAMEGIAERRYMREAIESMGFRYREHHEGGRSFYTIDVADWLAHRIGRHFN